MARWGRGKVFRVLMSADVFIRSGRLGTRRRRGRARMTYRRRVDGSQRGERAIFVSKASSGPMVGVNGTTSIVGVVSARVGVGVVSAREIALDFVNQGCDFAFKRFAHGSMVFEPDALGRTVFARVSRRAKTRVRRDASRHRRRGRRRRRRRHDGAA